jgi:hypothetical protein
MLPDAPRSAKSPRTQVQRLSVVLKRNWKKSIRSWANPMYHVRKMREDLSAAKHGLKIWHLGTLLDDQEKFAKAARGKFFATFVIAGACAAIAFPIGWAAQAASNSFWIGMGVTILAGHTAANLSFLTIWNFTNKDLYRHRGPFAVFEDMLPLLWRGIKVAAFLTVIALPLNGIIVKGLETFAANAIRFLPTSAFMAMLDALLFNSTYVRLMGNLYEKYANELAAKYCS